MTSQNRPQVSPPWCHVTKLGSLCAAGSHDSMQLNIDLCWQNGFCKQNTFLYAVGAWQRGESFGNISIRWYKYPYVGLRWTYSFFGCALLLMEQFFHLSDLTFKPLEDTSKSLLVKVLKRFCLMKIIRDCIPSLHLLKSLRHRAVHICLLCSGLLIMLRIFNKD